MVGVTLLGYHRKHVTCCLREYEWTVEETFKGRQLISRKAKWTVNRVGAKPQLFEEREGVLQASAFSPIDGHPWQLWLGWIQLIQVIQKNQCIFGLLKHYHGNNNIIEANKLYYRSG